MRKVLLGLVLLVAVAVTLAAAGLGWAHLAIRRARGPLPDPAAAVAAVGAVDGPARLAMLNTASQPMPRAAVLDRSRDPRPDAPYVMSHPSFVLEWSDGRLLLIDAGMNAEEARAFGAPMQVLAGAGPLEAHGSVAERLGDARTRVAWVIFTHLHTDHVGGIVDLCAGRDGALPVFMTTAQAERSNYTTRPGRRLIEGAACARPTVLGDGPLLAVPGFPGVVVIPAGGHTPDSQMILAGVADAGGSTTYAFVGDLANNLDGILEDIPKPPLYSLLVVPEDGARLAELRKFLRRLRYERGVIPLVSHDQRALESQLGRR